MVEEQNKALNQQKDTLPQPSIQEETSSFSNIAESNGEQKKEETIEHTTLTKQEETKRKVFKPNKRKNAKMDEGTRLFLRRERDKIRQRLSRMHEDEDKRKLRLEKDKMRKRISREMENDFERLRRRDKDRERQALKRKFEKEQREKKKQKSDNDFDQRVSMVDIGSTIVIKDTQIAGENIHNEIEVMVEVADDHQLEKVKEADSQDYIEEVRVPDHQHLEVVKLADGVCLQEVKVAEDHHIEEDDVRSKEGLKDVAHDAVRVTQDKSEYKVRSSEEAENLNKEKLNCVEEDTNNHEELDKPSNTAKTSK